MSRSARLGNFMGDDDDDDNDDMLSALRSHRQARESGARGSAGRKGASASSGGAAKGIYDAIPQEYLYNPRSTRPALYFLPKLVAAVEAKDPKAPPHLNLKSLLKAAEDDVRLHRSRVQAGIARDPKLLRTYKLEQDPEYRHRKERLAERLSLVGELESDADKILQEMEDSSASRGLTQAERAQVHLAKWQRALELYVHTQQEGLDWQSLFEKLLDGISEDQDISQVLAQAAELCSVLVESTNQAVRDTFDHVSDVQASYLVRLEAHQLYAGECLRQVGNIEDQFRTSGRTALQIGHQLEQNEVKRSQCEAASILIRRWWMLENLAEQERSSSGTRIDVEAEISGEVPEESCKLDSLFTVVENSLEAARALKQLRAVVRSRGNAAATGSASTAMIADAAATRRFDITASLITRISDAIEDRLLTSFMEVFKAGKVYDFSSKPRPGSIDWRELRSLAQALLLFDSARNIHKRYVDMVVELRFPELFAPKDKKNEHEGDKFDIDATRAKLSNIFHLAGTVCTNEFDMIARVFGSEGSQTDLLDGSEEMPLVVARALLQKVISDPTNGLQTRINDLLASIDQNGDFDSGAKKLDTFVVVHEKAAGLFSLLRDAAENMARDDSDSSRLRASARNAVESLKGFLNSQELALSNAHRQSYINLELRLLHHSCCASLDHAGCVMVKGPSPRLDKTLAEKGILEDYRAPVLPLHKETLVKIGFNGILAGPLKQSVMVRIQLTTLCEIVATFFFDDLPLLPHRPFVTMFRKSLVSVSQRQPLIHATDSLARARLMFGTTKRGGEATSRVILSIFSQMCAFYGEGFLYPMIDSMRELFPTSPPSQPPQLPFDEEQDAPELGVPAGFWVCLERMYQAAKSFDRELWAESREGSERVWETLEQCGDTAAMAFARDERTMFFADLERRGEATVSRGLDTLSSHIQWILVTGGESMLATGGTRILGSLTGQSGGPYAVPAGSSLETPNSPAVKSLTYCLRVQFVHIQNALSQQSLAKLWTALSMRLYDILVSRLIQHYLVSTVGAVILSRDVEALRSVALLAGTEHAHWDLLRELVTLYMTPPDAIKNMLIGIEGEPSKGLFSKTGRDQCLIFLSRRQDYRYKTAAGMKKSGWVNELLSELNINDPTDGYLNINLVLAQKIAH